MTSLTVDRLRVFVSSTITECAAERAAARDAVLSINHVPILFEDIGARPHPPRDLYKSRLEESQIFVGIYKESYGWIAPGMKISGVEDEFQIAETGGVDRLVYVYQSPSCRDTRLQDLVDKAMNSGITVAFYSDSEQLRDRVRNDLTAVISNRFSDQALFSFDAPKPEEVLESLVPTPVHRLRRPHVESALIDTLNECGRIVVTAPIGGGKTILLAQLSVENGWIFVDGQGLSRLDLLARAANAIRARLGRPAVTLTTEQGAISEILRNWDEIPEVVLVVDGASDPQVFWEAPGRGRHLVVTSGPRLSVPSNQRFELPPLTSEETVRWVTTLRGRRPGPGELADLIARSGGSPLYLRFFALGEGASAELSLRELEIRAIQSLPPRAKEITFYLALSPRPISLGNLHTLLDGEEGPESVAEQVSIASGLLRQVRGQIMLVHEHLRATILDQLNQSPDRLAFFASRLGQFFEDSERYLAAFHVYSEANERRHADRILERSAGQAVLMGGGALAIPVFRRQAELALDRGGHEERLQALLALAYALKQTGASDGVVQALEQARETANRLNEPACFVWLREMEAVLDIGDRPRTERIAELASLRNMFAENGDIFNAARSGTLLAAEYISGRDFRSAASVSREALRVFSDLGDQVGKRVASLNLLAALSGIGGLEEEAAALAQELQEELAPEEHPRERAALCNYLTRHYRESGDTVRAAEFAHEAIQIGEQLDDLHVIAINRVTLGNVLRDKGELDKALIEYHASDSAAVAGGLRDAESAANELIASVHNQREEYGDALHHAQHAVTLARLVGDHILIARAEEERAVALTGQRDHAEAISAYTAAVTAISAIRPGGSYFVSLASDALHLCTSLKNPDLKTQLLRGVFLPNSTRTGEDISPLSTLYRAVARMADTIKRIERIVPTVALSVADLLADVPPVVERRIVLQLTNAVVPPESESITTGRLAAAAAILLAQSSKELTLGDVTDVAERISASSARIYFKPQLDGSGHWTIRLGIADGVVVSLVQLDDNPRTAITTTVVALLLSSLDRVIRQRLVDVEHIPRGEAVITISNRKQLEAQVAVKLPNPGDLPKGFLVAESAGGPDSNQASILVACAEDFPVPWLPAEHALSDVHLLLGELLLALLGQVLEGAVEMEVLVPKIGGIVREVSLQGLAPHIHSRE